MARREFPALGFDPAPGDPAAVTAAAGGVDSAGRLFADAAATVARLGTSGWTGGAADAFRGQLADLPRDLDLAARSHTAAARALTSYAGALPGRQRLADELETRAAELRRQQQTAVAEVDRLAGQTAPAGSAALAALRGRYDAARSRADGLGTDLAAVLARARRLLDEHRGAAGTAARAVRAVADAPYEEPGWLSRGWDSVKSWISDHADVLRQISGVLKGVSAVLGVLSFVPGLQFLAPFAVAAGAIALLIDGALCLAGEGDWSTFALDAALTILPTGPVVRAFRRLPGVARGLDLAGDALANSRRAERLPFLRRIPRSPLEEAGNGLPRLAESQLTRNADGLVTHVDGTDVRDFLRTTSTDRAGLTRQQLLDDGLRPREHPAYSLTMDRRTGNLYESVNDVNLEHLDLHDPLIRRRIDEVVAQDVPRRPFQYSGSGDTGDFLHPSTPGTHAETYSTSQALDHRRGARLPVNDAVLRNGEVVVDVQNIQRGTPRPFGCCANCSRILSDVYSQSGRYPTFPHSGDLVRDVWPG